MSPLLTVAELNEINELMAEIAVLEAEAQQKAQELNITDPMKSVDAQIQTMLNVVHDIVCLPEDGKAVIHTDVILKAACMLIHVGRLVKRHGIKMNGPVY